MDASDVVLWDPLQDPAMRRHRLELVVRGRLRGRHAPQGLPLALGHGRVRFGLECLDGPPVLIALHVVIPTNHLIVAAMVGGRRAALALIRDNPGGGVGRWGHGGGGVGALGDRRGAFRALGIGGVAGLSRARLILQSGLALLIVNKDPVILAEPLLVGRIHPAHHPGHEGKGHEGLPEVDHVLGVDGDDDDDPRVGNDRVGRGQHKHRVLLDRLGLPGGERHHAQARDDKEVEGGGPDDRPRAEVPREEARAYRLDDVEHNLRSARPQRHQR
mmetsp:Transcript_19916/g.45866  ORF Transcript_19916/g.45866 Transcript_19916/m.45866 type:complete len:273 (-) Transcript_19916:791-1609(-)